ncbi:MAG: lysoplasmalogenase family protein [Erythrobacter sp.]
MPKRALIEHRPWLFASIVAAIAFYLLHGGPLGEIWLVAIKGLAVGCLAFYAIHRGSGTDATLIGAVLMFGALGDMAIEFDFGLGGGLFLVGHLIAIWLYLRKPREHHALSQTMLAASLLIGTPLISWFLSHDPLVVLYSAALGGMAASAWMSRFPRYRVGIGAVLFVVSDWLIFSRMGTFDLGVLPGYLIWPLYYAGQFLIATGVIHTLRHELAEEDDEVE